MCTRRCQFHKRILSTISSKHTSKNNEWQLDLNWLFGPTMLEVYIYHATVSTIWQSTISFYHASCNWGDCCHFGECTPLSIDSSILKAWGIIDANHQIDQGSAAIFVSIFWGQCCSSNCIVVVFKQHCLILSKGSWANVSSDCCLKSGIGKLAPVGCWLCLAPGIGSCTVWQFKHLWHIRSSAAINH